MKRYLLILFFFQVVLSQLFGQADGLTFFSGVSAFGINSEYLVDNYFGEVSLPGQRIDFGIKYSLPIIIRKKNQVPIFELEGGLSYNENDQNPLSYSRIDKLAFVHFQWGNDFRIHMRYGLADTRMYSDAGIEWFGPYDKRGKDHIKFDVYEFGLSYIFKNNHELGLNGVYRKARSHLYTSNILQSGNLRFRGAFNNYSEISMGVFLSYRFPIGFNLFLKEAFKEELE